MASSSFANNYRFIKRFNDGVVGLASSHGHQMFAVVKLRKHYRCAVCDVAVKPKTPVYSPITNGYNRMHRICVPCVEKLERTQ